MKDQKKFNFLKPGEGKESIWGSLLLSLYGKSRNKKIRRLLLQTIKKLEGGRLSVFYSVTLRKVFAKYFKVNIGMYTHGSCFDLGNLDRYTTVGRYCSIAANVQIFNRNHPMDFKSTHAFFFNPRLNLTQNDLIEYNALEIGNDVWIGHGAIILPNVTIIGDGAVIGAGSVVNKNVPPYAVVLGHPARVVRFRFPKEMIDDLLQEKWWEKSINEILPNIKEYQGLYGKDASNLCAEKVKE